MTLKDQTSSNQKITRIFAATSGLIAIISLYLYTKTSIELSEARTRMDSQQWHYEQMLSELITQIDSLEKEVNRIQSAELSHQ